MFVALIFTSVSDVYVTLVSNDMLFTTSIIYPVIASPPVSDGGDH